MVYVCTLSKELQEQAKQELGEDPDKRDHDIEHIRKWIQKQPHLKIRTDDWFILRFLRGCKFSVEKTKQKIDMHYTIKGMIPEWFEGRDPQDEKLRAFLKRGVLLPLKDCDDKGRRVIFFRQGAYTPEEFPVDLATKAMYMLIDIWYEMDEIHSITGIVNVMDLKGMSPSMMLHYPPTVMKKAVVLWQEGYVMRQKGIHYINAPPAFDTLFNTFRVLLKEKIKKRITVHGSNLDQLYEEVPQRILPRDYGGEAESVQELTDYWLGELDSRRQWILDDQKNRVDESKRPGKPKNTLDLFGIDGSFRKLNVD